MPVTRSHSINSRQEKEREPVDLRLEQDREDPAVTSKEDAEGGRGTYTPYVPIAGQSELQLVVRFTPSPPSSSDSVPKTPVHQIHGTPTTPPKPSKDDDPVPREKPEGLRELLNRDVPPLARKWQVSDERLASPRTAAVSGAARLQKQSRSHRYVPYNRHEITRSVLGSPFSSSESNPSPRRTSGRSARSAASSIEWVQNENTGSKNEEK
ncbi:hypothetical protein NLJ89_g10314 [Agrocybe chaxingu]|uniref:Uncharacterized protein n=1 Tax=Agrocybe chaxingu TaxID=84603 RepID=A0A9W8MSR7_9AGAR|nr:hypothetical protein NLJ89_g10314 [Agrocybe chaxingu]